MLSTLQTLAESALCNSLKKLEATPFECESKPLILLNQRGRIAGAAVLQRNIIKLQPKLFAQNQDYFVSDVIPHELAHLVVYQHYGRVKPHGKEWRYIMQELLGVAPRVTHTLDVKKAGIKMYDYTCACATVQLSAIRHNRIVQGKQSYLCRSCHQALQAVT
ncbi:SprT family zinc-dependent metalloprotease [Glaciecola sp. SC05]|uniref:SprT family zinc-dependent metalloprotease n=1 Tax=Glaciecola sp. SC05 TaxID=1987355 RepID=UPI003528967C